MTFGQANTGLDMVAHLSPNLVPSSVDLELQHPRNPSHAAFAHQAKLSLVPEVLFPWDICQRILAIVGWVRFRREVLEPIVCVDLQMKIWQRQLVTKLWLQFLRT